MMNREFPPHKIRDLGKTGATNLLSLIRDARKNDLTIALGSGASASVGLPIWVNLLKRISLTFFRHWESEAESGAGTYDRPPKNMSICLIEDEEKEAWPVEFNSLDQEIDNFAKAFAAGDPLIVAQQIRNSIRDQDWRYLLHHALYLHHEGLKTEDIKSNLLETLARLCKVTNCVKSVINYNYDNTFEIHLRREGVRCRAFWDPSFREKTGKLPIYYPHGYLPFPGGPVANIIISEGDYHGEFCEPYKWSNLVQIREFSKSTCLFIGTSMIDPNVRRLLGTSKSLSNKWHYAFLSKNSSPTNHQRLFYSLFDSDLHRLRVRVIRFPKIVSTSDPYIRLSDLISLVTGAIIDEDIIWE